MRLYSSHARYEDASMQPFYDLHAPKKATNLSINSDLLTKAKNLDIDLSVTLEQALVVVLRERKRV